MTVNSCILWRLITAYYDGYQLYTTHFNTAYKDADILSWTRTAVVLEVAAAAAVAVVVAVVVSKLVFYTGPP